MTDDDLTLPMAAAGCIAILIIGAVFGGLVWIARRLM